MKLNRPKPEKELVNITPLIDVVFILLIFFMLAGAIEPGDPFNVAPAQTTAEIRGDVKDFVVLIDQDGRIAIDDEIIARDDLRSEIRERMTLKPGALIQLKPDAEADAVEVIELMEEIRDAGAEYLVLLTVGKGGVEAVE
ncbi:MAG: biopolymer transporter ExbD [Ponticaulis sp.]|nr:biopolymer transporter ExbD [Ponticaulis sp.]|tara:strand:- start:134216 stop:134635 length:420 start_codon:yes stop_codon:yes gene_type:complete